MQIIQSPSKNFYVGRKGYKPELIVVHCTDGNAPGDFNWLRGEGGSRVSSSYYISPAGDVHQLVDDANGAWHAGNVLNPTAKLLKKNAFGITVNPNYYSLGIEVSLLGSQAIGHKQWASLKELVAHLAGKHGIVIDRDHVIGHKEIYAAKTCPGKIDVDALVRELQAAPAPVPPPIMVDKEAFKNQIINYIKSL